MFVLVGYEVGEIGISADLFCYWHYEEHVMLCKNTGWGEGDDEAFGPICVFQELIYHTSFGWATPGGFVSLLKIVGEFEG